MDKVKILCIIGTRPEVIKMAPVILELKNQSWATTRVIATAQHRQLLDQPLKLFDIIPDVDFNIMSYNQPLPELTAKLISRLNEFIALENPTTLIAQGDTTTVLTAAMVSFYQNIPFCHVEAGLRTQDLRQPYPEEMNRVVADRLSYLLFAPTQTSKKNLLAEGITEKSIYVTGNTVIDALLDIAKRNLSHDLPIDPNKRLILITAHRRESFGEPLLEICRAIRTIANAAKDIQILYPVHPNPNINDVVTKELAHQKNILLYHPMDYSDFIAVMKQAYLILTDSGGIQEEAPALHKPVLVLREKTERPEAIEAGVAKLVGTSHDTIVEETLALLNSPEKYSRMANGQSPYGDGHAGKKIVEIIKDHFYK